MKGVPKPWTMGIMKVRERIDRERDGERERESEGEM